MEFGMMPAEDSQQHLWGLSFEASISLVHVLQIVIFIFPVIIKFLTRVLNIWACLSLVKSRLHHRLYLLLTCVCNMEPKTVLCLSGRVNTIVHQEKLQSGWNKQIVISSHYEHSIQCRPSQPNYWEGPGPQDPGPSQDQYLCIWIHHWGRHETHQ